MIRSIKMGDLATNYFDDEKSVKREMAHIVDTRRDSIQMENGEISEITPNPVEISFLDVDNPGCPLDMNWIDGISVNAAAVDNLAEQIVKIPITEENEAAWLVKAVTCIDLTTLAGDDTWSNVNRLSHKAIEPVAWDLLKEMGFPKPEEITCAAVCVYPSRVADAFNTLSRCGKADKISVASVATGFPTGQYPLSTRLEEIQYAVSQGAKEIDIVLDRSLIINKKWNELYLEVKQMVAACGPNVHLKAILSVGELGSLTNIYKTSLICMMAGSHFIKTSTGKEAVNATIPFGIVMCQAIRDYYEVTGYKVGFKPAGGIKTGRDAINFLVLVKEILGKEWLSPNLFRIGASGLLTSIEKQLYTFVTGITPSLHEFTMI